MSKQEHLPVCRMCGGSAWKSLSRVKCMNPSCAAYVLDMTFHAWRSLMSRPRLAPEHAGDLRRKAAHGGTPSYLRDAIRAALAALGEE